MDELIILSVLWVLYCFLHSLLISIPFTRFVKNRMGENFYYYRLFFNIFSLVTLIPLLYYTYTLREEEFLIWSSYWVYVKYILIIVAVILLIAGAQGYSFLQFLGLKQIRDKNVEENDIISDTLNTSGVLGIIRHPWYAAVILLLWARDLDLPGLIVSIILTLYIIIGTYLEEYKLVRAFGSQYREYKKEVSMLIPFKWVYKVFFSKKNKVQ